MAGKGVKELLWHTFSCRHKSATSLSSLVPRIRKQWWIFLINLEFWRGEAAGSGRLSPTTLRMLTCLFFQVCCLMVTRWLPSSRHHINKKGKGRRDRASHDKEPKSYLEAPREPPLPSCWPKFVHMVTSSCKGELRKHLPSVYNCMAGGQGEGGVYIAPFL